MQTAGEWLIALLWVSGIWGAVAAWESQREASIWRKSAWGAWLVHSLSLTGTVGFLLYLLLSHRYDFYYAWAHGSRLLPVAYITAALWEGQEGSFLLWMVWHVLFGWVLLLRRDPYRWPLLAGLSATNGYLATFLLGQTFSPYIVAGGIGIVWGLWGAPSLPLRFRILGAIALSTVLLWEQPWGRLAILGTCIVLYTRGYLSLRPTLTAVAFALLPVREVWGSFPFLYLWEVKSEVPVGFIPSDGNGLNPLLQSFWMVIHPPVLFGGYAAAALPFWEGLLALREGTITPERSRRLLRFLWLAVGILGLGIALGAYWAYETLNFGGYWNWDPVENASFAPWLVLVAAAHLIWVWRRTRRGKTTALAFSLLPFPLVLYSSYLTRSGVLADSSVHSFTDLGLGNWLLWGVGVSMAALALPLFRTAPLSLNSLFRSALGIGALLLGSMAALLLLLTSLPALNKLLGTALALGSNALQVYYEWMGILAVPILMLMGYALLAAYRARGWEALLWISGALLAGTVGLLWWAGWDFVYHPAYRALLEKGWIERLRGGLFLLLDDLLWGSALVALGGAIALLVQRRSRQTVGAAVAHAGFALMLLGALLSSGYEKVLSQNFNPRSPSGGDNLFLPLGGEAPAVGYLVRYEGLLTPLPPVREAHPILREEGQTLWRFTDSVGLPYQTWLPDALLSPAGFIKPVSNPPVEAFLSQNLSWLPVEPADRRYRYRVTLTSLEGQKTYPLLLEADLSESSGLLAHPSHLRFWHGDLYIHLTSLPKPEKGIHQTSLALGIGDTVAWEDLTLTFERLTEVEGAPHPTFRAWLSAWKGHSLLARRFPVEFAIQEKDLLTPPATVAELGLSAQLEGFSLTEKRLRFRFALRQRPDSFITVKMLYKPFISLFWGGIILLMAGVGWAVLRHTPRRQA